MAIMPMPGQGPPTSPTPPVPNMPQPPDPGQLPDNYADRVKGLATTHPWMPHQTVATIAAMPASDHAVASIANQLKGLYGSVDHAVKYVQDDPLLQKDPSLGLYIRSYLTNTIGPMPLVESDLKHLQTQLLARGFNGGYQGITAAPGATLQANGVWTSAWQSAFNQYLSSIRAQALGGAQIGSVPVGKGIDALNQVLPRQAATSLIAFIKHLPDSVAQDIRTVAGAFGGAAYDISHPTGLGREITPQERAGQSSYSASFENALPGMSHVTPQQSFAAQPLRTQSMDVLQLAGDILATHGLLKAGGAIADAARATSWRSLDGLAAQRGPGTIASKFFGPVEAGETSKLPLLGKATTNVPILRMTGPVADKIAGGDGWYYRARTLMAAPYAVPGVKVAGAAVGQLGLRGAEIRGLGTLESAVGGQTSPLSQSIDTYQGVNQFDQAIQNRLQFTAWGHHFRPGMNTLAFVLHPQLGTPDTISASIGKDVSGMTDSVESAFGPSTGYGISIERGVNWTKHGDQHLSYKDMVNMAGGPAHYAQFWSNKIEEHAAATLAEEEWSRLPAQEQEAMMGEHGTFQDYAAMLQDRANGYLDRAAEGQVGPILKAAEWLMADDAPYLGQWGGHNGLSKRIAAEIDRTGMTPKAWLQKHMANYGEMSRIMRNIIIPRRNEFVSDEVPGSRIGAAPIDYLSQDQAHTDINALEKRYNDSVTALHADNPEPDSWKNFEDAASALRAYLQDQFAIDGPHMPADDQDMIRLLRQKADGQNPRLFPRIRAMRMAPGDEKPALIGGGRSADQMAREPDPLYATLEKNYRDTRDRMGENLNDETINQHMAAAKALQDHLESRGLADKPALRGNMETLPRGENKLNRYTTNPVFTKVKPSAALELIHEGANPAIHQWTNDRRLLGQGGGIVVVEHDPTGLSGEIDPGRDYAGQEALSGSARFMAHRDNGAGWNEDVRSVAFKSNQVGSSGKEATSLKVLRDQLEKVGYIKTESQEPGWEKWVRPDLVGGTIPTSPEAQQALDDLAKLGYMPVQGRGLGFRFHDNNLFDVADSHLTLARRFYESLGLSPRNIPSADIGFTWNQEFFNRLLQKIEAGKIRLYPTHTAQTIVAMMHDRDALPATPGMASWVQHSIGLHAYNVNFRRMVDDLMAHGQDEKEAQTIVAARLSQELENPQGLVHLTKGDLRKILSIRPKEQSQVAREAESQGIKVGPEGDKMYDEHAINEIYRTIQETNAAMPTRLIGWQKLENLTALGLSYMGRPLPGSIGRGVEYLPTRLITLRNKARFTLSPEFQARRVVKANVKISMDGVPPTFFPMRALMRGGEAAYREKMAYLDKIMPELKNPNYDDGTQALFAEDPWGIYNHRNFEAYAAWHWKQMGKTDTEVRQLIIKDFSYGSKAFGEGRSALERTVNFVFFPFSFDKTLYRNTGAYLLDHTAQRLMLQAGLEAYNRYNNEDPNGEHFLSSNWFQDRMPLIQEAQRMNAFAHGIGLGQFGGINAPLLNLFIPQSYPTTSQGVQVLRGILPIMREFQDFAKEASGTFNVVRQVTEDQFMHNPTIQGLKSSRQQTAAEALQGIFMAKPVAEVPTASLSAAYLYRRQLQALFKSYVDYNAHHTEKFKLGSNKTIFGQWAGHVVNATLIDYLTHQRYPAYQPDQSQLFYVQDQQAINDFTLQMQNAGHSDVAGFIPIMLKIGKAIYDGKLDTAQAAVDTRVIRNIAIQFAETVPGFLTFYNKNMLWQFGPLERVR